MIPVWAICIDASSMQPDILTFPNVWKLPRDKVCRVIYCRQDRSALVPRIGTFERVQRIAFDGYIPGLEIPPSKAYFQKLKCKMSIEHRPMTNINRRTCTRVVPMRCLVLGPGRTGTRCKPMSISLQSCLLNQTALHGKNIE